MEIMVWLSRREVGNFVDWKIGCLEGFQHRFTLPLTCALLPA